MSSLPCTCQAVEEMDCACSHEDNDIITWDGSGNGTALEALLTVDPDTDNIWSKSAAGQLVKLPVAVRTPPSCQAYHNAAISIPDEDGTVVTLNSERYDSDSMHSTVTNTSRLTFNTSGIYIVTFVCAFAGNTTGDRQALLRVNGSEFIAGHEKKALSSAGLECGMQVTAVEFFCEDDYVEAVVKQDSTGALNLLATRYSPILSAHYRRGVPS